MAGNDDDDEFTPDETEAFEKVPPEDAARLLRYGKWFSAKNPPKRQLIGSERQPVELDLDSLTYLELENLFSAIAKHPHHRLTQQKFLDEIAKNLAPPALPLTEEMKSKSKSAGAASPAQEIAKSLKRWI